MFREYSPPLWIDDDHGEEDLKGWHSARSASSSHHPSRPPSPCGSPSRSSPRRRRRSSSPCRSPRLPTNTVIGTTTPAAPTLTIQCQDELACTLTESQVRLSPVLMTSMKEGKATRYIPASFSIISKICCFLQHHDGTPPPDIPYPLRSCRMCEVVDKWNAAFIDDVWLRCKTDLFDLIVVARYLEMASLVELACAKIASLIKGKSLSYALETLRNDH